MQGKIKNSGVTGNQKRDEVGRENEAYRVVWDSRGVGSSLGVLGLSF